ncbi:MAG TPA: helix-turn-helix domain-containing protein, partial [Herpetosiphonaceae bacterium]|nr:helix-turn-helix domain-containing protein [Herpetosiphonaceae bacterium]
MYKIGDFSRLAQVSVRMLRHYDKLGLLKPSHTDEWTGYRYYTVDQLPRLNRIVALNGLGLTLQQIGGLLGEAGDLPAAQLRGMLLLQQARLAQELIEKQAQLDGVAARLAQIEREGQPSPYEMVIKAIPALPVAGLRQIVPSIDQMGYYCRTLYGYLYGQLRERRIAALPQEVTIYHAEEYAETNLDVEVAVGIDEARLDQPQGEGALGFHILPASPLVASLAYEGTYAELGAAALALLGWVGARQHMIAGPLR